MWKLSVRRMTPKKIITTLETRPIPEATFCNELRRGRALDKKIAASKYGIAIPNEKRNNARAPRAAEPTVPT